MPLHDHFQGPLAERRHWTAFHAAWATYIAEDLNERLAPGYFAEALVQFGIEIDVATWEEEAGPAKSSGTWQPGAPQLVLPFVVATDAIEILIQRNEGGPVLAGAIELVSPANKDRPASREAFVSKCAAYLHQGLGVVIIDLVTSKKANLHQQLLQRVTPPQGPGTAADEELFAASYRPAGSNDHVMLEVWQEVLQLGRPLPTLPLWLKGGYRLPLSLETSYERTIRKQRVLGNGS